MATEETIGVEPELLPCPHGCPTGMLRCGLCADDLEETCKTHPDAPHGFCRNGSITQDRYVCECEFWEPEA